MLLDEFEKRTGIYPSDSLYKAIEARYSDSLLDKDEFCRHYKNNVDGLASAIQQDANAEEWNRNLDYENEIRKNKSLIADLHKQNETLKQKLDREKEWKPYELSNMSSENYASLRTSCKGWKASSVVAWIASEFGFARERIRVVTTLPKYQISRHRELRKVGSEERPPLYYSTDWNYVRFDVSCDGVLWQYEAVNGQLFLFDS